MMDVRTPGSFVYKQKKNTYCISKRIFEHSLFMNNHQTTLTKNHKRICIWIENRQKIGGRQKDK